MVSTTTNGSVTLPLSSATMVVVSVTGFLSSGTVYLNTSGGVVNVTYTGTQTTPSVAFTGCSSGGTGTVSTGAIVTQTQDSGLSMGLDPVEALISPAAGNFGNPAAGLWSGSFLSTTVAYPNDFNTTEFGMSNIIFDAVNKPGSGGGSSIIYYIMVGEDVSTTTYDKWQSTGSPDYTGTYYTGSIINKPFRNVYVAYSW